MALMINTDNTRWEGKKLSRILVNVTSEEATKTHYSFDLGTEIFPYDLCFTTDGYIVFDNKIFPLNSSIGSEVEMELLKGGVTVKVGGMEDLQGETMYGSTDSKDAIPVYDTSRGHFVFKVGDQYFTHSTIYDEFYNTFYDTGNPPGPNGILPDKIYMYNGKLYIYDEKNGGLKSITFEPYVEEKSPGVFTLVLDDKPLR